MHKEVIRLLTHAAYDKLCAVRPDVQRSVKGRGSESCQGCPPPSGSSPPVSPAALEERQRLFIPGSVVLGQPGMASNRQRVGLV